MKKNIFIRSAPYNYKFLNKSLYESFDEAGLQKTKPHILKPDVEIKKKINSIIDKYAPLQVFCSESIKSQETARLFSKKIKMLSGLNEIKFSMNDFSSKKEFPTDELNHEKINEARFLFSQALINNQLQEKQEGIIKRIINLGEILKNYPDNQNILCISHGFIMKLFENYFLTGKKDIKSLVSAYDWKNPTYDFLNGFIISSENNAIKIDKI